MLSGSAIGKNLQDLTDLVQKPQGQGLFSINTSHCEANKWSSKAMANTCFELERYTTTCDYEVLLRGELMAPDRKTI